MINITNICQIKPDDILWHSDRDIGDGLMAQVKDMMYDTSDVIQLRQYKKPNSTVYIRQWHLDDGKCQLFVITLQHDPEYFL